MYIVELKIEMFLSVIFLLDIFKMIYYKFDKMNNKFENWDKNRKEKCFYFLVFDFFFRDEG